MNPITPTAKMSGHYKLEAFVPGNPKRVLAEFDNLITDFGLNYIAGSYSEILKKCSIGTGNTLPAYSDTTLAAKKAETTAYTDQFISSTSDYLSYKKTFQFSVGAASGNLAEVGIGTYENLFSRALIKDAQGNPTTIAVLPDEIQHVTWELRIAKPETVSGEVAIIGSGTHSYTLEVKEVSVINTYKNGYLVMGCRRPFFGAIASGYSEASVSVNNLNYVTNSFQKASKITANIHEANYPTGIGYVTFNLFEISGSYYSVKAVFDPPIMKTNEQKLTLDVVVSWARA